MPCGHRFTCDDGSNADLDLGASEKLSLLRSEEASKNGTGDVGELCEEVILPLCLFVHSCQYLSLCCLYLLILPNISSMKILGK